MKLLLELSDFILGLEEKESYFKNYRVRRAARAVILNTDGTIAMQFTEGRGSHKLPGGGAEEDESIQDALRREIKEEVGCEIEVVEPIGITIEYRKKYELLQISYVYLAKVKGAIGAPQFDEGEVEDGMVSFWTDIDTAISLTKNDVPKDYEGKFIQKRDLTILEEAKILLAK